MEIWVNKQVNKNDSKKPRPPLTVRWTRHSIPNHRNRRIPTSRNVLLLQQSRKHPEHSATQKKTKPTPLSSKEASLTAQQKLNLQQSTVNPPVISVGEVLKKLQDELRED
jgi:hypothetical protein